MLTAFPRWGNIRATETLLPDILSAIAEPLERPQADDSPRLVEERFAPELPRKRGRPKGLPKTGGRTKGVRNWTNDAIREELLERSQVIEVLADLIAGKQWLVGTEHGPGKATWRVPSGKERIAAIGLLADKILPSLKSSEITGKDGAPLNPPAEPAYDTDNPNHRREMAKAIIASLGRSVQEPAGSSGEGASRLPPVAGGHQEGSGAASDSASGPSLSTDVHEALQAAGLDGIDHHFSLDKPPVPPPPTKRQKPLEPGDEVRLKDCGDAFLVFGGTAPDDREKWWIMRCDGREMEFRFGQETAEARARQMFAHGKL